MAENKKAAKQMADEDFRHTVRFARDAGIPHHAFSYEHGIPKDLPPGDGEGTMMPFIMGMRDSLTKTDARKAAAMWRHLVAYYPKAIFYLNMLGYDQDPREIWEIVDAARYVRWFARAAGLDDLDEAQRILGPGSPTWEAGQAMADPIGNNGVAGTIGFLAACGVFGDELKQEALRQLNPTMRQ